MIRRTLFLAAAVLTGCAPMVNHPPRTDPGIYLGVTGGAVIPNDSALILAMTPMMSPYLRVSDRLASGWGVSASVAASFGARYGLQGDLYAEVPSGSDRWAHGFGLVTAGNYTMPYVQVGRQDEGGSGWYLTSGYALRGYQDANAELFNTGQGDVRPRYWSATLTGRKDSRFGGLEGYVTGALGHFDHRELVYDPEQPVTDTTVSRERLFSVSLGLSMETNLSRLFGGYHAYPPRRTPRPVPPPVPVP